jgi:hypothetical protein
VPQFDVGELRHVVGELHDLPEDPARHPDLLGVVVCPVA